MPRISKIIIVSLFLALFLASAHACSEKSVEYKNAGNTAMSAFRDLLNFTATAVNDASNITNAEYFEMYEQSLRDFTEAGRAYCNATSPTNYTDFLQLLKFSLKDMTTLQDLMQKNGFSCINTHRSEIGMCVEDNHISNWTRRSEYGRLWRASQLSYDELYCHQTGEIKSCVVKLIEGCDENLSKYVQKVFDYTISYCNNAVSAKKEKSGADKITGNLTALIMVFMWYIYLVKAPY